MTFRLRFAEVSDWPRLAWLAVCSASSADITCYAGRGVETNSSWFCEGVWAGAYVEGDLDQTDLVFGSGGRIRNDEAIFVSAGSTVDRLHSLETHDGALVSNSLPCLMSFGSACFDLDCRGYAGIFSSIRAGLRQYQSQLPTTAGPVQVTYFDNLAWDGVRLRVVAKPDLRRDFTSYARYRSFLDLSMAELVANARAAERTHPFDLVSTLSAGYDSTTATVLARQAGCREAIGFIRKGDSGEAIAKRLDVHFHAVRPWKWRSEPTALLAFLASGTTRKADTSFHGAKALLAGRLVFTGFHGDKAWDRNTKKLGTDIVRGDVSGLSLTEYRLSAGFVNCPVPYWGVRQIEAIHAISCSPELAEWDVDGDYSRPICRRIVEEAGVPREMFGFEKRATVEMILKRRDFLSPEMRRDYLRWTWSRRTDWFRRKELPPVPWGPSLISYDSQLRMSLGRMRANRWVQRLGARVDTLLAALTGDVELNKRRRLHRYVLHWAMDRAKEWYPTPGPLAYGALAEDDADRSRSVRAMPA
jgi:hypothetical protein